MGKKKDESNFSWRAGKHVVVHQCSSRCGDNRTKREEVTNIRVMEAEKQNKRKFASCKTSLRKHEWYTYQTNLGYISTLRKISPWEHIIPNNLLPTADKVGQTCSLV